MKASDPSLILAAVLISAALITPALAAPPTNCAGNQANGKYDINFGSSLYDMCYGEIGPTTVLNNSPFFFRCKLNDGRLTDWVGELKLGTNCRFTGSFTGKWTSGAPGTTPLVISMGTLDQSRNSIEFKTYNPTVSPRTYGNATGTKVPTARIIKAGNGISISSASKAEAGGPPPRP